MKKFNELSEGDIFHILSLDTFTITSYTFNRYEGSGDHRTLIFIGSKGKENSRKCTIGNLRKVTFKREIDNSIYSTDKKELTEIQLEVLKKAIKETERRLEAMIKIYDKAKLLELCQKSSEI